MPPWCCVLGGIRSASGAAVAALQDDRGGRSRRGRQAPARRASGRGRSNRRTMLLLPSLISPLASPPAFVSVCQAEPQSIKRRAALQRRVPHLPYFFHFGVTNKAAPSVNRALDVAMLDAATRPGWKLAFTERLVAVAEHANSPDRRHWGDRLAPRAAARQRRPRAARLCAISRALRGQRDAACQRGRGFDYWRAEGVGEAAFGQTRRRLAGRRCCCARAVRDSHSQHQ